MNYSTTIPFFARRWILILALGFFFFSHSLQSQSSEKPFTRLEGSLSFFQFNEPLNPGVRHEFYRERTIRGEFIVGLHPRWQVGARYSAVRTIPFFEKGSPTDTSDTYIAGIFARYILPIDDRFRFYVSMGPSIGNTCSCEDDPSELVLRKEGIVYLSKEWGIDYFIIRNKLAVTGQFEVNTTLKRPTTGEKTIAWNILTLGVRVVI